MMNTDARAAMEASPGPASPQKTKLLFLTFWSFDGEESNGICKKIRAQIRTLERAGFDVDLCCVRGGGVWLDRGGECVRLCRSYRFITRIAGSRALKRYLKREGRTYPAVFARYPQSDMEFVSLLRTLRKGGARIVTELPTYPYDLEFSTSLPLKVSRMIDRAFRGRLKKYVDCFVVYSAYSRVFGVPARHITNGVDFASVSLCQKSSSSEDGIHLIAVSTLSFWHGYERFIRSMGEYLRAGGKERFIFHVVGDGEQRAMYEQLAGEYGLEGRVLFHGFAGGGALDALYDMADCGVSPLTAFKKGLYGPESLKTIEYFAKGLPVLATEGPNPYRGMEDALLLAPADESSIDMDALAGFIRSVYAVEGYAAAHERIRAAARPLCSMDASFAPVLEILKGEAGI